MRRLHIGLTLLLAISISGCGTAFSPECLGPYTGSLATLKRHACNGDQAAQYDLGRSYEQGEGGQVDLKSAVHWYKRAAAWRSGTTYIYSPPVGKEQYGQAIPITTGAPSPGLAEAQAALGMMYLEGRGVKKDLKKARKWFERAADQGHVGARQALETLSNVD